MNANAGEIRTRLKARPFEPFSVVTADGEIIPIRNPDYCMLSPDNRDLHAYQIDFSYDLIKVRNITRLQSGPNFDPGDEPKPTA